VQKRVQAGRGCESAKPPFRDVRLAVHRAEHHAERKSPTGIVAARIRILDQRRFEIIAAAVEEHQQRR
jgi:hypothetical protein